MTFDDLEESADLCRKIKIDLSRLPDEATAFKADIEGRVLWLEGIVKNNRGPSFEQLKALHDLKVTVESWPGYPAKNVSPGHVVAVGIGAHKNGIMDFRVLLMQSDQPITEDAAREHGDRAARDLWPSAEGWTYSVAVARNTEAVHVMFVRTPDCSVYAHRTRIAELEAEVSRLRTVAVPKAPASKKIWWRK